MSTLRREIADQRGFDLNEPGVLLSLSCMSVRSVSMARPRLSWYSLRSSTRLWRTGGRSLGAGEPSTFLTLTTLGDREDLGESSSSWLPFSTLGASDWTRNDRRCRFRTAVPCLGLNAATH
jgi:hypothetical protein